MFKSEQSDTLTYKPTPEPIRAMPAVVSHETTTRVATVNTDKAIIGKDLIVLGDITGAESLFIDGKVEGSISLPGSRVTVGRNGYVDAAINAREVVVIGKVRGNLTASDLVDIHAEGTVTGDVIAARVSIESGAFFKGCIDIRRSEAKPAHSVNTALATNETLKPA
jgi:cytoskeletal protein CcmA (bactofilin family)